MVSAHVEKALFLLLPRDTRISRRVGLEQLGLFLLLKWLDQQEPGEFLALAESSYGWQNWLHEPELQRAGALDSFVANHLLSELRCRARRDPHKLLAPLFQQAKLLQCVFTDDAYRAVQLISELDMSQQTIRSACAEVFLAELDRIAQQERAGVYAVPDVICDLAVQLAGVKDNAVLYDPACVTGVVLARAVERHQAQGSGPSAVYADTTARQGLLAVVAALLVTGRPFATRILPPSERSDRYELMEPPCQADFVLACPPFGSGRKATRERINHDELAPIRLEEDLLTRALAALKPNGAKLVMIVPDGWLVGTGRSMVAARTKLLDDCQLFCVVSLPPGLFPGSPAKTSLLFGERNGTATTDDILYCEMPAAAVKDADCAEQSARAVVQLCRQWQSGGAVESASADLKWSTVPAERCRQDRYRLTPQIPLLPVAAAHAESSDQVLGRLLTAARHLDAALSQLLQLLPTKEEASL